MTKFSAAQQSQLAQIGAFLRENREKQGKSLEDIAISTYIRPQLLNGIEMGNPDMLPEPIFVQGFIRRYAENLGLKGLELSQQFTVNSIPSTPRPAPRVADAESSTTRLTRPVNSSNGQTSPPIATSETMFSAGNASPVGGSFTNDGREMHEKQIAATQSTTQSADLTMGDIPVIVDDAIKEPAEPLIEAPVASERSGSANQSLQADIPVVSGEIETPEIETPEIEAPMVDNLAISADSYAPGEEFADKVAAFDQANMKLPDSEALESNMSLTHMPLTAEPLTSESSDAPPQINEQLKGQFDDGLPATFTTQVTSTEPGTAPRTAYSSAPVGVEMRRDSESPNLKPFAIGAIVLAALTAGVVLLANLLGGDRTSPVVESPEPTTEPTVESVEPIEEVPAPAPAQPASSKPVYVEAEATAETYVSVRVDGIIVFEDIMQPGDTLLWEGEEIIDVYSGNAGGLTIAANGEPGEVLGEDGQLGQKIFEAP